MDYVVGGVAALISGNVTPNRPKHTRRALTPIKHQPSPNVTPKSELAGDRSIFLSPSIQKKKAIVKKSPKRIFQNPDLDVTQNSENNVSLLSPKAEKVKKNIKAELGVEDDHVTSNTTKRESHHKDESLIDTKASPKKKKTKSLKLAVDQESQEMEIKNEEQTFATEELTHAQNTCEASSKSPRKKKKKCKTEVIESNNSFDDNTDVTIEESPNKKKRKSVLELSNSECDTIEFKEESPKKKKRKSLLELSNNDCVTIEFKEESPKKKKRKSVLELSNNKCDTIESTQSSADKVKSKKSKKKKSRSFVNPNAITDKDSDSEHESDNEIQSENEDENKEIFKSEMPDESSDDESPPQQNQQEMQKKPDEKLTQDEINRTLFVGNVQFNKKCKKEVKKIFSKYGQIETVRIRTVPVKDARVTPKLALIKNELHPERTTVNVYVKFKHASSVEKALVENNTVLNERHLRVTKSDTTGALHDPNCAIFVGNMPFALEDEALRAKFQGCGEIESVRIVRDKKTNAGKGFGYVNFASKDGVELALAMSEEDLTIKNRILRVKRCFSTSQLQNLSNNQQQNRNNNRQQNQNNNRHNAQQQNQRNMHRHNQYNQQNATSRNPQGSYRGRGRGRGQGRNFGNRGFNHRAPNQEQTAPSQEQTAVGAQRRIMNKRKFQNANEGPPEKIQRQFSQPQKEKKVRQEFVGMTAEKKKKNNAFNKGEKKKRALGEILTK